MTTFVLIHGGGDSGWAWHLVEEELRALGHDTVAPDLPVEPSPTLIECADAVVQAAGNPSTPVAVVAHSFGGFVGPIVAERLPTQVLVFVAGMVPAPGESPNDWWADTGYADAVREQAAIDGGLTGNDDPFVCFFHDVPRPLAEEAMRRERSGSIAGLDAPWPMDALPAVPTRFVLCSEDRFFPPALMRRVADERLGVAPDEIEAGHCVSLSRPAELAAMLAGYVADRPGARMREAAAPAGLRIVPANQGGWEDVKAIFGTRGESSRCWCQRYKMAPGESWASVGAEELAARLREQTECGNPRSPTTSGLVAFLEDEPVGWCAVEPRPAYARMLRNMRVPWDGRSEDKHDEGVWAVTCFVTRTGYRKRGITHALTRAAVDFARDRGARALEGYPITTKDVILNELQVGSVGAFEAAGFTEVARPSLRRVVMRIDFE